MPIYPIKCPCGFAGDVFAKVSELDAKGRIICPECGERAEQVWSGRNVTVHGDEYHGERRSCADGRLAPDEVKRGQKLFGEAGASIQADGRVRFESKTAAKKFYRKEAEIKRLAQERRQERDGKGSGPDTLV